MRRSLSTLLTLVVSATMLVPALVATGGPASAAEPPPTITEDLHFKVQIGPADDRQTCDIVGDLYVPHDAEATNRMPAILSTNGFGGEKDDQDALSDYAARNGYVALTYSGLGFGGSSCKITLDHPDYDGQAAAQLIDYLGGAAGIAYTDEEHTQPAPVLDAVQLDPGTAHDPRVGMVGGSYGGQVQYAAASVTQKLDTIIPIITWNDLSYSLAPNNTDQKLLPGQELLGVSTETPGAVKQNWALGFSALGLTGDVQNQQPEMPVPCPNFADFVCPALITGAGFGTLTPAAVKALRAASVATYQDDVKIPTLILQGQADTLFNLNEAAATYEALQAQGTDVKMSWIEFGHSGPAAEGELNVGNPDPATQLITKRIFDWFGHYLKGDGSPTGPEFSYFRNWVDYTGIATKAYAQSDHFPVGLRSTYHLSSTERSSITGGQLVTRRGDVKAGRQDFVAPPGPGSTAEDPDVVDGFFQVPEDAELDGPGTFAKYDTDELARKVDVVGSPTVRLRVDAPSAALTQGADDAGKLVLFLKVLDVNESGKATVVRNLAAPVRVPDVTNPFTVTMPAFVHRFEAGHRIRLVVAGASPNYRGNNRPVEVGITTKAGSQPTRPLPAQSVTLPTLASVPGSTGGAPSGGSGGGSGDGGGAGTPTAPPEAGNGDGAGAGGAGGADAGTDPKDKDAAVATKPRDGSGTGSQAGPDAVATTSTATSSSLADTGGPALGLLGAGVLLVGLGGYLLARRRWASTS